MKNGIEQKNVDAERGGEKMVCKNSRNGGEDRERGA